VEMHLVRPGQRDRPALVDDQLHAESKARGKQFHPCPLATAGARPKGVGSAHWLRMHPLGVNAKRATGSIGKRSAKWAPRTEGRR
jgi:hypothetical protein